MEQIIYEKELWRNPTKDELIKGGSLTYREDLKLLNKDDAGSCNHVYIVKSSKSSDYFVWFSNKDNSQMDDSDMDRIRHALDIIAGLKDAGKVSYIYEKENGTFDADAKEIAQIMRPE